MTTPASPALELLRLQGKLHPYTPLRCSEFQRSLSNHPDKAWVSWLLHSIKHGISIGFIGPRTPLKSHNLISAYQHPDIINSELSTEIAAGRVLGPFTEKPFVNLRTSGLRAAPKKNGKWRVILHLSAPYGISVNDGISKEEFSLHYSTVDDAVRLFLKHGVGCLMAKVDLKSAFRMVPVRAKDWDLLGMYWQGMYYVDTCLPFGLRSAPYLFNQFAEALHWILSSQHSVEAIHYLDDFLLVGPAGQQQCATSVQSTLSACGNLGIPVAFDKLEGPATQLTFLGITLDSTTQQLSLPLDKQEDILHSIQGWRGRHKATKRELLSLIGKLSFAAKVVPAGRLFLRRLIDLSTTAKKLHHHIRITADAREDLAWWERFLPEWNGVAMFLDPDWTCANTLNLFTNASGTSGFGAYFNGSWFRGSWLPHQQLGTRSIQWQELFAIVAAAKVWGPRLAKRRVRFHCDNQAIVYAWSGQSSKDVVIMKLLRELFFTAANHNFSVQLVHIPGQHNPLADALSRNLLSRFFSLAPQADLHPTPTPPELADL